MKRDESNNAEKYLDDYLRRRYDNLKDQVMTSSNAKMSLING
jgi:hypothetical protein